jgi:transglutaminase-like putative cysteine protease
MRYVSPETRLTGPEEAFEDATSAPSLAWEKVRESLAGGKLWSAVLVLLLTLTISRSTAIVDWVPGIDAVTWIAVGGAVLLGALALSPVRDVVSLGIGLGAAPVVAFVGAWPQIHARHPTDVLGPQLIGVWWQRFGDGTASQDPSFYLVLINLLMWVTGAWLAWCVLRWRKPMLGLIPGAAAFATNVLNFPEDQNTPTLFMILLTLGLLLWTNYTSSVADATHANVKLTGDARWDFWESGLVAMAALIVLGILLPPLSTSDRTLDVESGLFSNWAQLQERLSHPGVAGTRTGTGVTGFTDDVKLSGSLQRTRDVVFTYTVIGDYAGPRYFRGVNETSTFAGEWRYVGQDGQTQIVPKNQNYLLAEDYEKLAAAGVQVHVFRPPVAPNSNVLFYPGQLYKVDRLSKGTQVPLVLSGRPGPAVLLYTIDRLDTVQPATSAGAYTATVEYSTAETSELQAAGTDYPAWLQQYTALPQGGYRPQPVIDRIHALAQSIVDKAGAKTPYDQASAIERYLRDGTNFKYSLDARTPPGRDPIDYFLFDSKTGYCEFFATAMGDMLRSLGVPTRLVNGFGPGSFDNQVNAFVVRGEDAHTWVEVYFPKYGWIPFEPTADPTNANYQVIQRGQNGAGLCLRDDNCDPNSVGAVGIGAGTPGSDKLPPGVRNEGNGAIAGGGIHVGALDANALMRIGGIFVALLLLLLVLASRYLRPRTVMAVWKRTLSLARLAGAEGRPGETPLELGRRLRRTFPETAEPMSMLASNFVVAAYAPPEVASTTHAPVMEAWSALRPMLLRRVFSRLRPTRP